MKRTTLLRAFRRGCRPVLAWQDAEYQDCNTRLLCGRCGRCTLHCTCPPPEMRFLDDGRKLAEVTR
jgi:hypothetical protein